LPLCLFRAFVPFFQQPKAALSLHQCKKKE
jgi:hypothetical protein